MKKGDARGNNKKPRRLVKMLCVGMRKDCFWHVGIGIAHLDRNEGGKGFFGAWRCASYSAASSSFADASAAASGAFVEKTLG